MTLFNGFASLVLASTIVSTLYAETRCPGNAESLPLRIVNRHQMIVAVSINNTGPFNFLLDTGTQITMVDPSLAAELNLTTQGTAIVASVGVRATASFAQLDHLTAGSHTVENQRVLVYDLRNLQVTGLSVRGVLGEDFLQQFDMLIDGAHNILCLDASATMRTAVKGPHIPLLHSDPADGTTLPQSLIVSVRLSDGMRPVRLKLDSGSNVSFLYNTSSYMALGLFRGTSLDGGGANGTHRTFTALPPQTVKIGAVEMPKVPFVTLADVQKDSHTSEFDGLLTIGLFRRIF